MREEGEKERNEKERERKKHVSAESRLQKKFIKNKTLGRGASSPWGGVGCSLLGLCVNVCLGVHVLALEALLGGYIDSSVRDRMLYFIVLLASILHIYPVTRNLK